MQVMTLSWPQLAVVTRPLPSPLQMIVHPDFQVTDGKVQILVSNSRASMPSTPVLRATRVSFLNLLIALTGSHYIALLARRIFSDGLAGTRSISWC